MVTYDKINTYISDGDKDYELYQLFTSARYLVFRARERELQRYNLTPEQAQVLLAVQAMNGRATPAELSRQLLRQPHTISAIVDRMEKNGLVEKTKDLERKNMVRVALTEMGERALEVTVKRGPIHRILSTLSEEERESFQQNLEKITLMAQKELGMDRDKLPSSELN